MKQVIDEQFLQQMELFSLSVKDNVAGLFGGNHKSKKDGSSCEFADYRDYIEEADKNLHRHLQFDVLLSKG